MITTTTTPTTTTLAERARAAYQKREADTARKLQAQRERDRKLCQVTLAEILELPLDAVTVVDHRVEGRLYFELPFTATVDGLTFVFHVFGDPRTVYVHLVPGEGISAPFDLPGDPLEHYSRCVTSLADLGSLLEYFEPHYI